jgi:hypothetical protein
MSWNRKEPPIAIYVDDGTVPRSVPKGRVLMHNHVLPDVDTPSGTNGFLGWREPGRRPVSCSATADGRTGYRITHVPM